jgi:hypothetical protein
MAEWVISQTKDNSLVVTLQYGIGSMIGNRQTGGTKPRQRRRDPDRINGIRI